jgi:hypothetical protein
MSTLKSAFNNLLNLQARTMTYEPRDVSIPSFKIKVVPSNYFRNLAGPEEIVIEGQEFVISREFLGDYGAPKRGDFLLDDELGSNTITEVRPMMDLGGGIIGYRVRSS